LLLISILSSNWRWKGGGGGGEKKRKEKRGDEGGRLLWLVYPRENEFPAVVVTGAGVGRKKKKKK